MAIQPSKDVHVTTREEVKTAKEQWEQAKLSYALSLAGWGILRDNKGAIIQSLIEKGFTQGASFAAFDAYDDDKRKTSEELNAFMNQAEKHFSDLDAKFRSQDA